MLQLLICSDLHTFIQNIPPAMDRLDRVDAILIAGDLEAEMDDLLSITDGIPVYAVTGNNDYYLNTDYPEELLIDIKSTAGSSPYIGNVRELRYSDQPELYARLPSILRRKPFDKISAAKWGDHRPDIRQGVAQYFPIGKVFIHAYSHLDLLSFTLNLLLRSGKGFQMTGENVQEPLKTSRFIGFFLVFNTDLKFAVRLHEINIGMASGSPFFAA